MSTADRSSIEIKVLLKNLDPTKPSIKHKDRLRRLNKFRNYVTTKPPPDFYDDDYSLLLLGSDSPSALEDEDLSNVTLYGLLRAAGCPSTDHKDALKRSARPSISLLRYLCLEFDTKGKPNIMGELNGFASAFCALNIPQLRFICFDAHIGKGTNESGNRGGSKEDACFLLALLLTRHTDTDQETPKPIKIQDLLPASSSQAEFNAWLLQNAPLDVRRAVKDTAGAGGRGLEERESSFIKAAISGTKMTSTIEEHGDEDDVLEVFGKKSSPRRKVPTSSSAEKETIRLASVTTGSKVSTFTPGRKPVRWSETEMASKTRDIGGAIFLEEEREKALAKRKKDEEAKQRLIGRDPLGIHTNSQFDLREIDTNREYLIQQMLKNIENEIQEELALANETGIENVNWLESQRQALLKVMQSKKPNTNKNEGDESLLLPSLLPTNIDFDPILFLTVAHRNTSYEDLLKSTSRLSRKTDSQVERLQNLVRDNFALFIKCSEGIDVFAENDRKNKSNSSSSAIKKLNHRYEKLEALAESCSEEARKSFKPLLDNTNEVRKVQSALSVLQRVAPLLQLPSLMRQHIENASFSSVVKAYRKVMVIDRRYCDIELLRYVRTKANEAAQDARHDLELILADESSSATVLLDAVRDLGELLELLEHDGDSEDIFHENTVPNTPRSRGPSINATKTGTFTIDNQIICVREHPPALACLLLQAAHFRSLVEKAIFSAENSSERIYRGEGPNDYNSIESKSSEERRKISDGTENNSASSQPSRDKRWKYEALDTRVSSAVRAVSLAKNWLPRLIQIGLATQEAEKRREARHVRKSIFDESTEEKTDVDIAGKKVFLPIEIFTNTVRPSLTHLVQHVAFCALGCANQGSKYRLDPTFGKNSPEKLRILLQAPLPPSQTAKCAFELAALADVIQESNESMFTMRHIDDDSEGVHSTYKPPFEGCVKSSKEAVSMIEKRVCIYSFDSCARKCSISASGSGTFDGDSLLQCVQKLSEDLTRPDECRDEVEKGCVLVVQRICEGLTNYVKDRSDTARLRVVAECADSLNTTILDIVREVSFLTNDQSDTFESNISSIISTLEREMFDIFLDTVKRNIASCARLGLIESNSDTDQVTVAKAEELSPFPSYLAASFLAIVRCRAQVERALHEATIRRSEGITYQFLALQTSSDAVVENICHDFKSKLNMIRPARADVFSIHLQFLLNSLKKYLSAEILLLGSDTKRMLLTKAGSGGRQVQKEIENGPEGLTALENLERLGRVYLLCLGD